MTDVFVIAEAHPARPTLSPWHDDPLVLVMGVEDPSVLAAWLRSHEVSGVIVVNRRSADRPVRLAVNLAAGAAPHIPIVQVTHSASALAAALAARAVAARWEPLGSKVERFKRVVSASCSGAVLSSIAGLREPDPGVGRHLVSYIPWGGPFVVQFAPTVRFRRGKRAELPSQVGPVPWAVSEGRGDLIGPLASAQVERPVIDVRAEYGSRGREFALLRWLDDDRPVAGRCPVCGARCLSTVCPVCHVHVLVEESLA